MTKKIKDLAVKVGTYESNGKTKNRYVNVGLVLQKDDGGEFILINRTFNPAGVPNPDGKDTVLISAFDPKDDKKPQQQETVQQAQSSDMDDDLPF